MKRKLPLILFFWVVVTAACFGQGAALQKVTAKYTSEQLADLQTNTPYKFQGLILFYAESWFVNDQGSLRFPAEQEILTVNIDQYTGIRSETERVRILDADSGLNIELMGRKEFEQHYMSRLNAQDLEAYLAYKNAAKTLQQKSNE